MLAAFLTTLLFATSAVCGYRTAKQVGGIEANFWRITLATIFLTVWAFTIGHGFDGAPGWFLLSGFFGIGLGDSCYFQALPRLGSRRTVLLTQCLTAPFAALIEYFWLGTKLNLAEIVFATVILGGVAIALKPGDHLQLSARDWKTGVVAGIFAALGAAIGFVIIRKGYAAIHDAGLNVDAGTTGYQRVLGGILIPTATLLIFKWRSARAHGPAFAGDTLQISRDKWARIWPWVLANALAGQTLGVTCMQWALKTTQAGIVAAIVATTPVVLLPMTRIMDGEKIDLRALLGALVAVGGVIGLTLCRN
jgi:drug/metabolite transporter (DMT)-like permease